MTGEESARRSPGALTEEEAGRVVAGMNEVIRAGEEMRGLRAELVAALARAGWTQERIARLTGMSQPAVSKQVAKYRADGGDPRPVLELSLDQDDAPWLEGRLWGLAEEIAERLSGAAACDRYVTAFARGRKHFTPRTVDELRRLVEEDLRRHPERLPGGCREAYDRISRGLDVPSAAPDAPAAAPAPVRRALACRMQRARLQGGA